MEGVECSIEGVYALHRKTRKYLKQLFFRGLQTDVQALY